jgi:hypothetical protein
MEMIRRGRRNKRDDGVLVVATRRITIDDNPVARGARPVFNLQTLWNEWGGSTTKFAISASDGASWEGILQQWGTDSEAGDSGLRLGFSGTREFGGETM